MLTIEFDTYDRWEIWEDAQSFEGGSPDLLLLIFVRDPFIFSNPPGLHESCGVVLC